MLASAARLGCPVSIDALVCSSCWFQIWIAFQGDPALGGIDAYYAACPTPSSVVEQPDPLRLCYRGLGMLHLRKARIPAPGVVRKCPDDITERYWCSFRIGWAMMSGHMTMFQTPEGFESSCSEFEELYKPACVAGEEHELIPSEGL